MVVCRDVDTAAAVYTVLFFLVLAVGMVVARSRQVLCFRRFRIDERGNVY